MEGTVTKKEKAVPISQGKELVRETPRILELRVKGQTAQVPNKQIMGPATTEMKIPMETVEMTTAETETVEMTTAEMETVEIQMVMQTEEIQMVEILKEQVTVQIKLRAHLIQLHLQKLKP